MSATPPSSSRPQATIASTASLPPRVRRILDTLFTRVSADLGARLNLMLIDFEHQLFAQAERARNNAQQAEQFANLHALRQNRGDLLPLFMAGLEAEVAGIRLAQVPTVDGGQRPSEHRTLSLVEHAEVDQDVVLNEIARHHDTRAQTQLYLLGQRFGVLAGSPALDPAVLPVGPQALCRVLRTAVAALRIDLPSQLLLYKSFDQKAMLGYDEWIDGLNELLSREGVLPGLVFTPRRARNDQGSIASRRATLGPADALDAARPMTGWHGEASPATWTTLGLDMARAHATEHRATGGKVVAGADAASFAVLQQLLSGRHAALSVPPLPGGRLLGMSAQASVGRPLATHDVLSTLRLLQAAPVAMLPGQPRRTMLDVQETLLGQVREQYGPDATLVQEDADTFELLGLLYNEIEREVQRDTQAEELLVRLQVPVAQAALHDREFFLRPQHPARELLNSVAESGAAWLGEDETDPQLIRKLQHAVDRVVNEYEGDDGVFESVNSEVQAHFDAMARKAEVAERRHVEAARGKDRLEVAKHRAGEAIETALQGHAPQKFVQALLDQAWADVLTLTLLRNGDDSEEWHTQEKITQRIIAATCTDTDAQAEAGAEVATDEPLAPQIQSALIQVGYHEDEAAAIARRLSNASNEDDKVSNTELSVRLKARGEFGEQTVAKKAPPPKRTSKEQKCHEYLRTLPFGTWFEFTRNQQGDVVRQRLSWFNPVTDNALFVNQRGQRIGEQSLDSLARLMAREQVHVVTEGKSRLIDRAWQATVNTLRNFTGGGAHATGEVGA